jgi:hypothetical protein
MALGEADPTAPDQGGDGAQWIVGNLLDYDSKSAVQRKYLEHYWDGDPLAYPFENAPTTQYGRQRYDAFGRQVQTFDLDGTVTLQSVYHALGTDLWDAADLENGPHTGSYLDGVRASLSVVSELASTWPLTSVTTRCTGGFTRPASRPITA